MRPAFAAAGASARIGECPPVLFVGQSLRCLRGRPTIFGCDGPSNSCVRRGNEHFSLGKKWPCGLINGKEDAPGCRRVQKAGQQKKSLFKCTVSGAPQLDESQRGGMSAAAALTGRCQFLAYVAFVGAANDPSGWAAACAHVR